MKKVITYQERLDESIKWLFKAYEATGNNGFSIGFDIRKGWRAPYAETTGYIIPTLYRYSKLAGSPEAFKLATDAACWLISNQNSDGSINDFIGPPKNPSIRPAVVFNTGQDLFGLISAYNATQDDVFLDSAKKAAYWIITQQKDDGAWHDETSFGAPVFAAYYSHVSWPLYLVGQMTNDEYIMQQAEKALKKILDNVNENLTVTNWGFRTGAPAYTHTIAYTIEGILEQSLLMGGVNSAGFLTAKKIALKTLDLIGKDGRLAGEYNKDWEGDFSYVCMPGNCQLALIYLRLYALLNEDKYIIAAQKALNPVFKRQHLSVLSPSAIKGSIPASWPPVFGKYMRWLYPNWGTKYLADILMAFIEVTLDNSVAHGQIKYSELIKQFPG